MLDQPELSPFAEELIPEAFARPHTAFRVHRIDVPLWGEGGFEEFIGSMLRYTLSCRGEGGAFPARIVVIEGGDDVAWYWGDDVCCLPEWTVERVRREARPIPEPWLFAIELLRSEPPLDDRTDPRDAPWQDLTWLALWYAEARGRGMADTRAGVVRLEQVPGEERDQVMGHATLIPSRDSITRNFHRILHAHPARKEHPLRRSR